MPGPGSPPLVMTLGGTKTWNGVAKNKNGVIAFAPTDPSPVAEVSRGKGQAVLFSPTCVWTNAPLGQYTLTITAAQLAAAGITPGQYHLVVRATPALDNQPRVLHDGRITFRATAGTATLPPTYASVDDLENYAPEIQALQDKDTELTDFAEQRAKARQVFEQARLDLYRPVLGRSRRLVDITGTVAGPYDRFSPSPDGSPAPTPATVKAWFAAGKLFATGPILEANARYAAALVFLAQPDKDYAAIGRAYMAEAEAAFRTVVVEFDANNSPPVTPTHRIDRDVTYLT